MSRVPWTISSCSGMPASRHDCSVDDRLVFLNIIRPFREKVTYCPQMTDRSGAERPTGYSGELLPESNDQSASVSLKVLARLGYGPRPTLIA